MSTTSAQLRDLSSKRCEPCAAFRDAFRVIKPVNGQRIVAPQTLSDLEMFRSPHRVEQTV